MRPRFTLCKVVALIPILAALYYIRCQYAFQRALPGLYVSFDDFTPSYNTALNASPTRGEPLLDFDYNTSFPSSLIPRKIHFIYFADLYHRNDGTPSLPATSRSRAPGLCRKFNPSFEIRIWNETEAHAFLETEYPWFVPTYDAYKHPIQRVDALKYFVLYHHGGVYMDLDVACRRPLEPLLQYAAWFPEASPLGVNNDLMASMPRHPIFLEMTSALASRNWNLLFPYLTIFWSTGPQFTGDVLRRWWWRHSARLGTHDTASFRILPRIFYSEDYTFFGHSSGGTWHGGDVAIVLWFVERPLALLCISGVCLGLAVKLTKSMRLKRIKLEHEEEGILRTDE